MKLAKYTIDIIEVNNKILTEKLDEITEILTNKISLLLIALNNCKVQSQVTHKSELSHSYRSRILLLLVKCS